MEENKTLHRRRETVEKRCEDLAEMNEEFKSQLDAAEQACTMQTTFEP